jgi:hypothetical protein
VKKGPGLLDTGPLVSFLAAGLRHHSWTCEQWRIFRPPLLTCEPVLRCNAIWFDVGKDGFLIPVLAEQARGVPITVVVNWQAGLKK